MTLILIGQLVSLAMGGLLFWGLGPWSLGRGDRASKQTGELLRTDDALAGRLVLAAGVMLLSGIGLAGLGAWLHLQLNLQWSLPLLVVDLLLLLVLACVMLVYRSKAAATAKAVMLVAPDAKTLGSLAVVLCWLLRVWGVMVALATFVVAWSNLTRRPWGDWDAIMIWNARARFLDRGEELWQLGFQLPVIHPDYPILLPMSVYRLWQYQGGESPFAPQLVSFVFLLAGCLVLWGTLRICRGSVIAWVGLLALLANSFYLNFGSLQLADVPVGTFLMAGWAMMALAGHQQKQTELASDSSSESAAQRSEHTWRLWVLAGLMFGCMAWVKNEGLLMLVATGAGVLVTRKPSRWILRDKRLLLAMALGAVLFVVAIAWAKFSLAVSNDLFRNQSNQPDDPTPWDKLVDPSRHKLIFTAYWEFLRANVTVWSSVLLVLLLPIAGWRPGRLGGVLLGMGTALFLTTTGYYTVYLVTPHDLTWHLSTSLSRLMTQLWPVFVLWAMLGLQLPWAKRAKGL